MRYKQVGFMYGGRVFKKKRDAVSHRNRMLSMANIQDQIESNGGRYERLLKKIESVKRVYVERSKK